MPSKCLDLIVANSVVQYLSGEELENFLATCRHKLADTGRLVLADIIPRNVGPLTDAIQLLRFALPNRFFLPAFVGLGRAFFSNYRQTRSKLGLLQFDEQEMLQTLSRAGFNATRHPKNMGHNSVRMTFVATPAGT
jgi:hypothetical protein